VGAAGDARLVASWRRRRELVAGGEGLSRLGADGASGGRRRKCRGGWGLGLRPAAHRGYGGGRLGGSAAAGDGDGCGGGRWGSRVREVRRAMGIPRAGGGGLIFYGTH
jgi:hypothetical protein